MSDFFEIDFLDIVEAKSGDAILVRYQINDSSYIHIVDGGYQDTGEKIIEHVQKYYGNPSYIDRVILSHPDGDHAGGLRKVLEDLEVKELWMLRPWEYAGEMIDRFSRFSSVPSLQKRLKDIYPNIAILEEIAETKGIPIYEPFQGARIGAFTVMAPSKPRYLDLILESEKTPESTTEATASMRSTLSSMLTEVVSFVKSLWGKKIFQQKKPVLKMR